MFFGIEGMTGEQKWWLNLWATLLWPIPVIVAMCLWYHYSCYVEEQETIQKMAIYGYTSQPREVYTGSYKTYVVCWTKAGYSPKEPDHGEAGR